MTDFSRHFAVYSKALDLRTQRHQVLASNIANADTPGFKSRDFEFATAMQNAMGGKAAGGGVGLARTASGHMSGDASMAGPGALQFRSESQSSADGNTVDMDVERAQITDNALQYQIITQLITNRFQGLRTAMSSTQS
jgi:flagellar basal-body rod protein FlgB